MAESEAGSENKTKYSLFGEMSACVMRAQRTTHAWVEGERESLLRVEGVRRFNATRTAISYVQGEGVITGRHLPSAQLSSNRVCM